MSSQPKAVGPIIAIRVALHAEVSTAGQLLRGRRVDVHAARKALKRARALVRLLRDAIGDAAYRKLNTSLRNVARPLSSVRDCEVLLQTIGRMSSEVTHAERAKAQLQKRCRAQHSAFTKQVVEIRRRVDTLARAVQRLPEPQEPGWQFVSAALRRAYKRSRAAFESACDHANIETLHEWRKQVQYLRHQTSALQNLAPKWPRKLCKQLHSLADLLGDDHDLAVLLDHLARDPSAKREDSSSSRKPIDARRKGLQKKAFAAGEKLFKQRPQRLLRRFGLDESL